MNTDHTLEEVGKQFDVTRERIRQIEAKALRKLQAPDPFGPTAGAFCWKTRRLVASQKTGLLPGFFCAKNRRGAASLRRSISLASTRLYLLDFASHVGL